MFFSGCNLRCVFCQNHDIAHQRNGFDVTPEELAEWYLKLQEVGKVHNINLVTPEHVVPQVVLSILHARKLGLQLPIVYNTSAFDSLESMDLLEGLVDIYLPDFKVWNPTTSKRLLKADNYAAAARESIRKMHAQVGDLCFTADGIAKKGLLIRHLVMPGKEDEGREIMRWVGSHISTDTFINIMEQYHPDAHVGQPQRASKAILSSEDTQNLGGVRPDMANGPRQAGLNTLNGVNAVGPGGGAISSRYEDINRPITQDELLTVRKAAETAGLWRFCDPVQHNGFNI